MRHPLGFEVRGRCWRHPRDASLGRACPRYFAEGGEHVGEFDQVIHDASGFLDAIRPADDERHARSGVRHAAFASHHLGAVPRGNDRLVGAVVSGENDKGVVAYAGLFQLGHDLPDGFVGVGHHVPEMSLGIVAVSLVGGGTEPLGIPIGGVRSRIEGAVGKNHRVIDEEGFLFILVDKVADKVRADLRTIFAARVILLLAVEFEQWVDETAIDGLAVFFGTAAAGMLPKTGFLITKVLRSVLFLAQLPLAGDRSCVTAALS